MDVEKTSTLTVTNTTLNDSGDYVCVVTSAPFTNVNSSDPVLVLIQGQLSHAYIHLQLLVIHLH